MAVFAYTGIDAGKGKNVKGFRDAENLRALRIALKRDGIMLTSAEEGGKEKEKKRGEVDFVSMFARISPSEIAIITRQLATLIRAGIPLVESISALTEQVENEALVRILSAVGEDLRQGTSFAKSLEKHPKAFQVLYVNMVAAGEASGKLEAVMERLAEFMENQARMKGKVASALAYPLVMSVFGTGLVSFLMVFVVPKMTGIFENLGQALPWYTQLLIFSSSLVSNYWWLLFGVGALLTWLFLRWKGTEEGGYRWDTLKLKFPVLGRLNLLVAVARFTRTLATLLASGVQLLPAMEIGRKVMENRKLEAVISEAIGSIREGESIAEPLKRSGAFPPMVTHMIAVGEKSGQLEQMLENVSGAYESEVENKVTAVTSMLEPIIIGVMGGAVGFIVVSIMMPLMQMTDLVQ
ncbi:MAG: type II secretion system inner membrane protein GspF [Polyangiaceae bacterium]|nr:type II secretion system inner membrane protein GspF [Polyangiaceae bacterium]